MNNGAVAFLIPCDVEGSGALYSMGRQEMSFSISCLRMPEGQKRIKRINGKDLPLE
jgi:hypothetical protein